MADGTVKEEARYFHASAAGAESAVARWAPGTVRVVATIAADLLALTLSAFAATALARSLDDVPVAMRLFGAFPSDPRGGPLAMVAILVPWTLFVFYVVGLYRKPARNIGWSAVSESLKGLTALTAASWVVFLAMVFARGNDQPVGILVAYWFLGTLMVPFMRLLSRATVWARPEFEERTLIIGAGTVGHTVAHKISKHPEYRIRLVGFLDDGEPLTGDTGPSLPVVGVLRDLDEIIARERVTRVVVAFSRARHQQFLSVVRTCNEHNVRVNIVPRLFEVVSSRAGLDDVEGIPLLDVANVELGRFNMFVKRCFDLVVAGIAMLVIVPLLGVLAVLIKLDSPGPVFFRQERMGRGGRVFRVFKLRSMKVGAERERMQLADLNEYSGPMFKMQDDPRVTRVGRYLRRWSLDELPQIFNVARGDMSLVGPRPLWVEEAKQCRGWTKKRLDITPGMTGLWQVLGRNDIPFDEMVRLDYMYVTGWSLSWDIKLLMQTVPAVLAKRGAY